MTRLALAGLMAVFITAGVLGVDFGRHWDEHHTYKFASKAALHGDLIPHRYLYPSIAFDVYLASLMPTVWSEGREAAAELGMGYPHRLRMRSVFVVLTSLTILWVFLAARNASRGDDVAALLAAACVALSFEISYHSRFLATDALNLQFVALSLAASLAAYREPEGLRRWIGAAAAAGLAASAKYTGGFVIATMIAALCAAKGLTLGERTYRLAAAFVAFSVAFFITSPGVALEFSSFVQHLGFAVRYYAAGHGGYTVSPGWAHLGLILTYLSTQLFSPFTPVAIALFALALTGFALLARRDYGLAIVLLVAPLAYTIYIAQNAVMVVRNLIPITPYLAVGTGLGLAALIRTAWPYAPAKWGLGVAGLVLVGTQSIFLVRAGAGIPHFDRPAMLEAFEQELAAHPERRLHVSKRIVQLVSEVGASLPATARSEADEAEFFALTTAELRPWSANAWPANVPGRYTALGPSDVNFDYYPSWQGRERIVILPRDAYLEIQPSIPAAASMEKPTRAKEFR